MVRLAVLSVAVMAVILFPQCRGQNGRPNDMRTLERYFLSHYANEREGRGEGLAEEGREGRFFEEGREGRGNFFEEGREGRFLEEGREGRGNFFEEGREGRFFEEGRGGYGQEGRMTETSGSSRTGGHASWDWEWDQAGERGAEVEPEATTREGETTGTTAGGTTTSASTGSSGSRQAFDRLNSIVEELQLSLFMNDVRDSSRMYQDICPRLMEMMQRGFMKNWLWSYMQNLKTEETRTESTTRGEREGEWTSGFARLLRRRPESHEPVRDTQRDAPRSTSGAANSLLQGLIASCYIYQDVVHGNAPRLDSSPQWRANAAVVAQ